MTKKDYEVLVDILAIADYTPEQKMKINNIFIKDNPKFKANLFWRKVEGQK